MKVAHHEGRKPGNRLWLCAPVIAAAVTVLAAGPSYAQTSSSPSSAHGAANKSAAPCPPPPPQHHDSKDHGFFQVKIEKQAHRQYLVTLTFRCYDKGETQQAKVSFNGVAPTGDGKPVNVLSGDTSFAFLGNQSTAVVDAQKAYPLDPTVLGTAASGGWHIRIRVPSTPDESATRSALVVLPASSGHTPQPSATPRPTSGPHVLAQKVAVKRTLPSTGFSTGPKLLAVSLFAIALGLYLCYIATLPLRRLHKRRH